MPDELDFGSDGLESMFSVCESPWPTGGRESPRQPTFPLKGVTPGAMGR
jgi:hypothetical protein